MTKNQVYPFFPNRMYVLIFIYIFLDEVLVSASRSYFHYQVLQVRHSFLALNSRCCYIVIQLHSASAATDATATSMNLVVYNLCSLVSAYHQLWNL